MENQEISPINSFQNKHFASFNSFSEGMDGLEMPTTISLNMPVHFSRGASDFNGQGNLDFMSERAEDVSQISSYSLFDQNLVSVARDGFSTEIVKATDSTRNAIDGIIGRSFSTVNSKFISEYEVIFVGEKVQQIEFAITEDLELLKIELLGYYSALRKCIEQVRTMLVEKYQQFKKKYLIKNTHAVGINTRA